MSAWLGEFHFLRPMWLLLLISVPCLPWLWRRLGVAADPWRGVIDPHLLTALRAQGETVRPARLPLLLAMLALLVATLALAGPAWQRLPQPLVRAESALIVALDLSERMRAADLQPDRIARARFKLADLLRQRGDGQTALIAYAGDAFTVAPLTNDAATLESLLGALDQDTLPVGGQRPDRAIRMASKLLADAGFSRGQLLLLTDRADARAEQAAQAALAAGLRVSVIGVGTREGAPIPQPGGGFLHDANGALLLPALDENSLRALARAGGGQYSPLRVDAADLERLGVLEAGADARLREDEQRVAQFRDEGIWLVWLLLPLAALAFRRGWLFCLPWLLISLPQPAQAFDLASLWQRGDQRAWEALQAGDNEAARAVAKDPALRGAAAYRAGDFAAAAEAFAADDSARGHYNRGNALAQGGQLEAALTAYDEALQRDPDMDDARANRAAVEQALQAEQQSSSEQGEQGQDGGQDSKSQSGQPSSEGGEPSDEASGDDAQSDEGESQSAQGDAQNPSESGSETDEATDAQDADAGDAEGQPTQQFSEDMDAALSEQSNAEENAAQAVPAEEGAAEDESSAAESLPALSAEEIEAREQQQAIEQWLRGIPDDPGGLLRRKFLIEQRQRQRHEDD